ncbi:MAG: hypothetical protein JO257_05280 [Deltaproteobacteria bacterium]|nr:hypothetical protein [Deltaproteobacteria bacterium]
MRALFVSLYSDTPHFETELELIADLLDAGNSVDVLRCTGALPACLKNPEHREGWCGLCRSKIERGLATIASPRLRVFDLAATVPDPRLPARFASADELKAFTLDGLELGRGVYSTMCGRAGKDTHFDTVQWAPQIRSELEAAYMVLAGVRAHIAARRPDRIYVFNGRFASTWPAILAAEEAGLPFFTHERGGSTDRYLLRERALPHDIALNHAEIEAVWAAGEPDREAQARTWFEERKAGVERSWESFTKAQSVGKLPDGFDPGAHNIAIFISTLEEYASIQGWENPLYPDEVVGLARIVDAVRDKPVRLYVRVHPHMKGIARDTNYQLREYSRLAAPNLTMIWPESPVHTYALLEAARVTLTFGSTVGVEACYFGKPSVLAGRALYEQLDCAHVARSHDDVIRMLLAPPPPKPQLGALKYAYWESHRGTKYTRFRPIGLYDGEWLGRPCRASLSARLQNIVLSRLGR